ncbi:hypothetical protein LCGC14_0835840 [marine sediment metagenome]|uniref:Uncharacterized protein n=1 Tax=marine sediment metagenome TaxID=412755 RepID=A0A0F9PJC4_9ZZZZ
MARAKVTLRGARSFQSQSGDKWEKNQTRIITSDKAIRFYRVQSEFVVTMLADAAQPPPPPESEKPNAYTAAALGRTAKPDLQNLGAERFELTLEDSMRKDDMITAILEAQG